MLPILPCGQVVPNRLLKSAMSETLGTKDNRPTQRLVQLYRTWAEGGIGLSVTGNVMVDRGALGEPGNVVIEDDRDLPLLQEWAAAGKSAGGLIYVQLNHPGRQVPRFRNDGAVAPSAVPFGPRLAKTMATARALEATEIEGLVQRFATAAAVVAAAGFDGVQLHGAHGYLVSQFLSPLTNQRADGWGGSADGRRRFVLEVIGAMRAATPDGFGVAIKINSADFQRGGITEDESMGTIAALAEAGVDFVEVSGGTYEAPAMMVDRKQSTQEREAYFLDFAVKLRERLDLPLAVTGGFRSGAAMAAAVDSGALDLVGLARPLGIRPRLPAELLEQGDLRVELPAVGTGIKAIDGLGMVELLWYERQLHRMGKGLEPQPGIGGLRALVGYAWDNGLRAMQPRRGR
jgi:2,4-dienoyl-CoA reductase-like NADH-dependent reductase (Old Yellow Enzyme family)